MDGGTTDAASECSGLEPSGCVEGAAEDAGLARASLLLTSSRGMESSMMHAKTPASAQLHSTV